MPPGVTRASKRKEEKEEEKKERKKKGGKGNKHGVAWAPSIGGAQARARTKHGAPTSLGVKYNV